MPQDINGIEIEVGDIIVASVSLGYRSTGNQLQMLKVTKINPSGSVSGEVIIRGTQLYADPEEARKATVQQTERKAYITEKGPK